MFAFQNSECSPEQSKFVVSDRFSSGTMDTALSDEEVQIVKVPRGKKRQSDDVAAEDKPPEKQGRGSRVGRSPCIVPDCEELRVNCKTCCLKHERPHCGLNIQMENARAEGDMETWTTWEMVMEDDQSLGWEIG